MHWHRLSCSCITRNWHVGMHTLRHGCRRWIDYTAIIKYEWKQSQASGVTVNSSHGQLITQSFCHTVNLSQVLFNKWHDCSSSRSVKVADKLRNGPTLLTYCGDGWGVWRLTVPGTVDKRCQLQPAMAVLSVLRSLVVVVVHARNVWLLGVSASDTQWRFLPRDAMLAWY